MRLQLGGNFPSQRRAAFHFSMARHRFLSTADAKSLAGPLSEPTTISSSTAPSTNSGGRISSIQLVWSMSFGLIVIDVTALSGPMVSGRRVHSYFAGFGVHQAQAFTCSHTCSDEGTLPTGFPRNRTLLVSERACRLSDMPL